MLNSLRKLVGRRDKKDQNSTHIKGNRSLSGRNRSLTTTGSPAKSKSNLDTTSVGSTPPTPSAAPVVPVQDDTARNEAKRKSEAALAIWSLEIIRGNIDYEPGVYIRAGGYAYIYKGKWTKEGQGTETRTIALKKISSGGTNQATVLKAQDRLKREYHAQIALKHCNIVPLYGIWDDINLDPDERLPYLVMPWYAHGNLLEYLPCLMPPSDAGNSRARFRLVKEVVEGIYYLHQEDRVHGDLSPDNILIDDERHARIADFGFSRVVGELGFTTSNRSYRAEFEPPERGTAEDREPGDIARAKGRKAGDVWSFGMIALMIMTDRYRSNGLSTEQQWSGTLPRREKFKPLDMPDWDEFWNVLQDLCWVTNPSNRATMEEVRDALSRIGDYPMQEC